MRAASKRHTKTTRSTRVCLPAPTKMISSRAIPRARVAMLITEGSPDRPRSPAAENPRGAAPADSSSRVVSGEQMLRTCPSRPRTGQVVAETGTHRRMSECTGPARVTFIARFPRSGEIAPVSVFQVPPRTPKPVRSPQNGHRLNTLAGHSNTLAARPPSAGAALYPGRQP